MTRLCHVPEQNIMKLTFWEVAQAVEASNDWQQWPDFPLTGIEFDSRKIVKGNLLFLYKVKMMVIVLLRVPWLMAVRPLFGDRI